MNLKGKNAVVVGMGTLGPAAAEALISEGVDKIVVTNRDMKDANPNAEKLRRAFGAEPIEVIPLAVDVTDSFSIQSFVSSLAELMPENIDILLVTSGGNDPNAIINKVEGPREAASDTPAPMDVRQNLTAKYDAWDPEAMADVYLANVTGPVELCMALMKRLVEQDRAPVIITIGSVSPLLSGVNHYAGAKVALELETHRLSVALAIDRIQLGLHPGRAVCIKWGFTTSEQSRNLLEDKQGNPTYRGAQIMQGTPLHRLASADEFGSTVVFIVCNEYISGCTGDGGFSGGPQGPIVV